VNADYAFRISGRLTPAVAGLLEPLELLAPVDGSADTLLVGRVTDCAALYGCIAHVEALGLELVELRRLPARDESGGHVCPVCGRKGAGGPPATGKAARSRS
jgi:hypothetical protein